MDGWPDERWLVFDGVEPDNVDGYANDTGFPLTAAGWRISRVASGSPSG
jgi:hypothetical protein